MDISKTPKIGDRRIAKCPETNQAVEQEYVGENGGGNDKGWLCLHNE
jgi:hypothetical protein